MARGYRGARSRSYRVAKDAIMKALQYAYRDRKEDDDEDPTVAMRVIFRSGARILLGFCLGLLFWGVIRNL